MRRTSPPRVLLQHPHGGLFHVGDEELVAEDDGVDRLPAAGGAERPQVAVVPVEEDDLPAERVGDVLHAVGVEADVERLHERAGPLRARQALEGLFPQIEDHHRLVRVADIDAAVEDGDAVGLVDAADDLFLPDHEAVERGLLGLDVLALS